MWKKPDSEDLLPVFMQNAMGFLKALAVFFGLPAITACVLMRHNYADYTQFPALYMLTLDSIFKSQNIFYLIHIVPAIAVRFFYGQKFKAGSAFLIAMFLFGMAVLSLYPISSVLNPQILKNIASFIMAPPLLMAFFILRIHRLLASGSAVILVFMGLLCVNFFR